MAGPLSLDLHEFTTGTEKQLGLSALGRASLTGRSLSLCKSHLLPGPQPPVVD